MHSSLVEDSPSSTINPSSESERSLRQAAITVAADARRRAAELDKDGATLRDDISALFDAGLLMAPFPLDLGGAGLGIGADPLHDVLVAIGRGSLAVGRLYEGHVNAIALVRRFGSTRNLEHLRNEARAGRPSGVWMAGPPLRFVEGELAGHKLLASGCGLVHRPLVAADTPAGSQMLIPHVDPARMNAADWTAQGMRATATGTVDFSGIAIAADEIVGRPGDYLRSPYFRGGAWRVLAVQLGGLLCLMDQYREQLCESPHRAHPLQLARYGEAAIALETARLWVLRAAEVAESPGDPGEIDAYVDLARNAFEAVALKVITLAQKALGLKALLRPNPIERIARDLSTYLRQPALDVSLLSAAAFHLGGSRREASE